MEALSDGGFRFLRPDGVEVVAAPGLPAIDTSDTWARVAQFVQKGVEIGPGTGRPTWDGERPDYEWMGWCLQVGQDGSG